MAIYTIHSSLSTEAEIYDLLTDPSKGQNTILSGVNICLEKHEPIDGMLTFDISDEQAEYLSQNYEVELCCEDGMEPELENFTLTDISQGVNIPTMGGWNFNDNVNTSNALSHHLFHCQDISVGKDKTDYTTVKNLSTIDCSNVDVVVIDTGIDVTHPDVSSNTVQFDWFQLSDGLDGTISTGGRILSALLDQSGNNYSALPENYYTDGAGHGTACASLVAGERSGLAKNAKLYAIKFLYGQGQAEYYTSVQNAIVVMKLCLAFQRAKNNNKLGLDSTRPTIYTNSWGISFHSSTSLAGITKDMGSCDLMGMVPSLTGNIQRYYGKGDVDHYPTTRVAAGSDSYNIYVEQIVALGGHWLTSAGNSNRMCDVSQVKELSIFNELGTLDWFSTTNPTRVLSVPYTKELIENQTMRDTLTSTGFTLSASRMNPSSLETPFLYERVNFNRGTNLGLNVTGAHFGSQKRNIYPLTDFVTTPSIPARRLHINKYLNENTIHYQRGYRVSPSSIYENQYSVDDSELVSTIVGDITPVHNPYSKTVYSAISQLLGDHIPALHLQDGPIAYNYLSGNEYTNKFDGDILFDGNRYNALSSVDYVKTGYSDYGPDVDVYAPGNGTLVAQSNQMPSYLTGSSPSFAVSTNNKFKYFNGTSASCPIAASCLATFLADNPTATPKEAKQWLIDSSLKGNILETSSETFNDNISADNIYDCKYHRRSDGIPMSAKATSFALLSGLHYASYGYFHNSNFHDRLYFTLNDEEKRLHMLHNHRFHDSNNRVVQAYPLRKAIVKQEASAPAATIKVLSGASLTLNSGVLTSSNITHLSSDFV